MSGVSLAPELVEPIPIPEVLPVLPVRDVAVFPAMIVPLFVSRVITLSAIEAALAGDRLVFVVAQQDGKDDSPRVPEDVYRMGTVCTVLRQRKLPDGRLKVLVQGLVKGTLEEVTQREPGVRARVAQIAEPPFDAQGDEERAMQAEALVRAVKQQLEKLIAIGKVISPETLLVLSGVQDPGRLADLCAANLSLKLVESQELLEVLDPVARLKRIHDRLAKEEQLSFMQARLQSQAKEEISRTQRDYYLREQLRQIQHELGAKDGKAEMLAELTASIAQAGLPTAAAEDAKKELLRLESMSLDSAEGSVLRGHLEWLCELPWAKTTVDVLDLATARRVLDEDHYGLAQVKERILEALSVKKLKPDGKSPILLLLGPPGVGKTSLARSIARAMGRQLARAELGGVRDEGEIRGHRRTYVGAMPGRILMGLKNAQSRNPVFVLDELDKLGADFRGDPSAALLEVLDPELNHAFRDHYLNLDFDLSQVFFIATANTLDPVPPALRDRMETIELPGYSEEEKVVIVERHLWPRTLLAHGLSPALKLQRAVVQKIIRGYTREAGLRMLTRELAAICRKIALKVAEGGKAPTAITVRALQALLGSPKIIPDDEPQEDLVGCATGLAYTPVGGEVLKIEVAALRTQGKGRGLILTGQLGAVMQESAQAALTWVRGRADTWGISPDFFDTHELHLHVPAGAIPKDGPSAGSTMACALASLICKRPCKKGVAMTGELTLRGRILAIGGLREKLLAAARAGIKTVLVPAQNDRDLLDLPKSLRRRVQVIQVRTVDELLSHALVGGAPTGALPVRVAIAPAR